MLFIKAFHGIAFGSNLAQSNLICSTFGFVDIFERLKAIKKVPITIRILVVSLKFVGNYLPLKKLVLSLQL